MFSDIVCMRVRVRLGVCVCVCVETPWLVVLKHAHSV